MYKENSTKAPGGSIENYRGCGVFVWTVNLVHQSADRSLSILFRLSRAKVGTINDERAALSVL